MMLTNIERETVIVFNEQEKAGSVYTCNVRLIKKLSGYCERYPELFQLETEDDVSKTFVVPKKFIKVMAPKIMTDEQKEKARERMQKMRAI